MGCSRAGSGQRQSRAQQLPLLLIPKLLPPLDTFVPSRDGFLGRGDDDRYFKSHILEQRFLLSLNRHVSK